MQEANSELTVCITGNTGGQTAAIQTTVGELNGRLTSGGAGIHFFLSGGVVPGLLVAAGYDFTINDKLTIPLELRIEPVFGNATPVPVLLGTGLKYRLQ